MDKSKLQFQTLQEILTEFQNIGVEGETSVFNKDTLKYSTAMEFDAANSRLYTKTWGAMSNEKQSLVIPFSIRISTAQEAKEENIILSASDLSNIAFTVEAIYINSLPDENATQTTAEQGGQS